MLYLSPQQPLTFRQFLCWSLPAVLHAWPAAVAMSVDHKPNTREERTRIEDAGGVVVWAGTWRVGGVLAVSRAFGDRPLKRYVIPTPDIRDEQLTHDDDCLILASDGLWDVVSNQVRATQPTHGCCLRSGSSCAPLRTGLPLPTFLAGDVAASAYTLWVLVLIQHMRRQPHWHHQCCVDFLAKDRYHHL